jgi:hypothetical protein
VITLLTLSALPGNLAELVMQTRQLGIRIDIRQSFLRRKEVGIIMQLTQKDGGEAATSYNHFQIASLSISSGPWIPIMLDSADLRASGGRLD